MTGRAEPHGHVSRLVSEARRSQTACHMSMRETIPLDPSRLSREELEAEVERLRARVAEAGLGRRQRAVLDSTTSFGIILTDRGGLVTDWNVGAERILGWSAQEMCGRDLERIFTPEDNAVDRAGTEMPRRGCRAAISTGAV